MVKQVSKVVYIWHFWVVAVGSRDLSQAEKKVTVVKPEQIYKMTIIFTQNGQQWSFSVKIVTILWHQLSA